MELLTPREAARRLGVSYPTLKQWIYKGSIRTRRTAGGHHRVPDTEIDRLLARAGRGLPRAKRTAGAIVALSGRNQLRGIVEEVRVEGLLAQVRLRVGDQSLTAIITRDAVDEAQAHARRRCAGRREINRGDDRACRRRGRRRASPAPVIDSDHEEDLQSGVTLRSTTSDQACTRTRSPAAIASPGSPVSCSERKSLSSAVFSTIVHRSPHFASATVNSSGSWCELNIR